MLEKEDLGGGLDREDDITGLLAAWGEGDLEAGEELMRRVGGRLRRLAGNFLQREREDHTLQTTALIHEAYLRLIRQENVSWQDRQHFFAITGRMMRRILVDHARRQSYLKRGGDLERMGAEALEYQPSSQRDEQLLALDEALEELAKAAPQRARMVELRYFGGLNKEEIAEVLQISPATVSRWWQVCRVWLYTFIVEGKRLGV